MVRVNVRGSNVEVGRVSAASGVGMAMDGMVFCACWIAILRRYVVLAYTF